MLALISFVLAVGLWCIRIERTASGSRSGAARGRLRPPVRRDQVLFHTKIVGVTFNGRQSVVDQLQVGQRLTLVRQPGNKHDPDAIAVHITNANGRRGTQVGWIKAETADGLALRLDNGERLGAFVATLTGGEHDNRGVNIAIYKLPE